MKTFLADAMSESQRAAEQREQEVPSGRLECILASRALPAPDFPGALRGGGGPVRIIAEVKRLSPSAGQINSGASIAETAATYQRAGAAAVSVLTSAFGFGGSVGDISEAVAACGIPVLYKDFVSLPYQVLEAAALGASAVLLIADALESNRIEELARLARAVGCEALVEVHTEKALERAIDAGARVVGINNRDLDTLKVNLETTERLAGLVPPGIIVVSESGIKTRWDVQRIEALGVDALLIGEALMRAPDPGEMLGELIGR